MVREEIAAVPLLGIAHLELLRRRLEIEVDHRLPPGRVFKWFETRASRYALRDLDGQNAFPNARLPKKYRQFALKPEIAEQRLRHRQDLGHVHPLVGRF